MQGLLPSGGRHGLRSAGCLDLQAVHGAAARKRYQGASPPSGTHPPLHLSLNLWPFLTSPPPAGGRAGRRAGGMARGGAPEAQAPPSAPTSLPLRCLAPVAAAVPGRRLILLDCFRTIFSCMSRSTRVSCIRPPWDLAYGEVKRFTHYFSDLQQLSYNFKFSQTAQVALIYKMTPCTLLTRAAIQS